VRKSVYCLTTVKLVTCDIDEVRDPVRFLSGRRILSNNMMFLAWRLTRKMTDVKTSPTAGYRTLVGDINMYNRPTYSLSTHIPCEGEGRRKTSTQDPT
jgi:hypothetical protein